LEKPPIKSIILAWIDDRGEWRSSPSGKTYKVISNSSMMESLKILAKTLLDYGYKYEEIDTSRVSILIADTCWKEDKIRKMSVGEIRKAKKNLADDWDAIIHSSEFSGITISTLKENEKIVPVQKNEKKEKTLEIDPKDRIRMDTSDMLDAPLDVDFLEELGIDESFVSGKKNG
jgi:hypothetical protein